MARKRTLRVEEERLWQRLTRTVRPLSPPNREETLYTDGQSSEGKPAPGSRKSLARQAVPAGRKSPGQRPIVGAAASSRSKPQPLSEAGDPRQARHVSRGRRQIDATLDLHGLTQEQAFAALTRFLDQARAIGYTTVLVITGKGAPEDAARPVHDRPRGILRRRFLDWAEGPLRPHISSIRQSHQKHGGAGAFYVFLKK